MSCEFLSCFRIRCEGFGDRSRSASLQGGDVVFEFFSDRRVCKAVSAFLQGERLCKCKRVGFLRVIRSHCIFFV